MMDGPMTKDKTLAHYIGQRTTSKGRLVHAFVKDVGNADHFTFWPKAAASAFSGARIGREYDLSDGLPVLWLEAETGNSVDPETAMRWQTISKSLQAQKQQKSVDTSPELTKAIKTIQRALFLQPRSQRMAFVAWLLNQLT